MRLFLPLLFIIVLSPCSYTADFNLVDFSVVADGRTDCSEAIQKVFDAAGRAGGGRIIIPPADKPYLVSKTITLRFSNIEVLAEGATLQLADNIVKSSKDHLFHIVGEKGQKISNVVVKGLTLDANFWNQGFAVKEGICPRGLVVNYAQKVLFDDVHVKRAWVSVSFSSGTFDCEARDCTVSQWHNDGFNAADGAKKIKFVRCRAYNAIDEKEGGPPGSRDNAWEIEDGVNNITLIDCIVEKAGGKAFTVRSHDRPSVSKNIRFIRCCVLAPGTSWIISGRDHDTRTEGVLLRDCQSLYDLYCRNGADKVEIIGGKFGTVKLVSPRGVHIKEAEIKKININVQEKFDGKETYCPRITLENVKLEQAPIIIGDKSVVTIINNSE